MDYRGSIDANRRNRRAQFLPANRHQSDPSWLPRPTAAINSAGIYRIDRKACFQQGVMSKPWLVSTIQAICSFWSAPVMVSRNPFSLTSPSRCDPPASKPPCDPPHPAPRYHDVDLPSPRQRTTSESPLLLNPVPESPVLILWCSKHDFSSAVSLRNGAREVRAFGIGQAVWRE